MPHCPAILDIHGWYDAAGKIHSSCRMPWENSGSVVDFNDIYGSTSACDHPRSGSIDYGRKRSSRAQDFLDLASAKLQPGFAAGMVCFPLWGKRSAGG